MSQYPVHFKVPGRLVLVGFGCIGLGGLLLILGHLALPPVRITLVAQMLPEPMRRVIRVSPFNRFGLRREDAVAAKAGEAQESFDQITDHGRNDTREDTAIRRAIEQVDAN